MSSAFISIDLREIEDTLSDGSMLLENLEEILGDNQNILVLLHFLIFMTIITKLHLIKLLIN